MDKLNPLGGFKPTYMGVPDDHHLDPPSGPVPDPEDLEHGGWDRGSETPSDMPEPRDHHLDPPGPADRFGDEPWE